MVKLLVELDAVPVQAAVPVGEHGEQRETGAQVFVDHVGAPDLMRATFAQAEQAGGVVDLAVHQDDRADAGIAQGAARLHRRETLQLRADVRRSVAQHPVHAVVGNRDGRLGARLGTQAAVAKTCAVDAVAVPLRETAAGGGTENLDEHGRSIISTRENKNAPANRGVAYRRQNLAAGEVHGDFKADTQVGVSRFGPGHGSAPSGEWDSC